MRLHVQRGFTFFEIIGLLVILAVLAMILFPVFITSRHVERQNICLNNQRQLAVGIIGYAQDNDEVLPLPNEWIAATGLVNDPKVFDCDQDKNKKGTPTNPDYGYNAHLVDMSTGTPQPLALDKIDEPTVIEVTCDIAESLPLGTNTITAMTREGSMRHRGGALVSYLDGHVAYSLAADLGHGSEIYNIPNVSSVACNFQKMTTAVEANAAIRQGWCGNSSATPPGKFNPKTKTWDLPAGASLVSVLPPAPRGNTMLLEYTCKPGVNVCVQELSCRSSDSNLLFINGKKGVIRFGCCSPANQGGQALTYASYGKEKLTGNKPTHLCLTISTGYSPDTAQAIARNDNNTPYLYTAGDNDTYLLATPLSATVNILAPTKAQLNYIGNYLVWHRATDSPRAITAENGPISIRRLFVSH